MTFWKEFLTDWIVWTALAALTCFVGITFLAIT